MRLIVPLRFPFPSTLVKVYCSSIQLVKVLISSTVELNNLRSEEVVKARMTIANESPVVAPGMSPLNTLNTGLSFPLFCFVQIMTIYLIIPARLRPAATHASTGTTEKPLRSFKSKASPIV